MGVASLVGVTSLAVLWTWPRYISCGGRELSFVVVGVASLRWACSLCGGRPHGSSPPPSSWRSSPCVLILQRR